MSEIKTTCRGTSRLIEVATMTHEEYLNLHTQGEKELRAAYEALQKELGYSKMAADAEAKFADEYKDKFEAQKQRAYALALVINDLTRMVTYKGVVSPMQRDGGAAHLETIAELLKDAARYRFLRDTCNSTSYVKLYIQDLSGVRLDSFVDAEMGKAKP